MLRAHGAGCVAGRKAREYPDAQYVLHSIWTSYIKMLQHVYSQIDWPRPAVCHAQIGIEATVTCNAVAHYMELNRGTSILSAEMDGGKKLEACLADFGLSAVLPSPKQHKDSPLL